MRLAGLSFLALALTPGAALADASLAEGHDWSGLSAGVFGGWQWADLDQTELRTDAFGGAWWFPPGPNPGYSYDDNDFMAGLQADWNWQSGSFVAGLGVELGHMNLETDAADPNAPPVPIPEPGGPVTEFDGGLFGSVTGRAGFAADRWLAYLRGGVSLLDAEAVTRDTCARSFCGQLTIEARGDEVLFGLTGGAGLEYAIGSRTTIGAEYRVYGFEGLTVSGVASNFETYRQTVTPDLIHTARISINFEF